MEGTVHIDQALTNISIAYRNGTFVADRCYMPVPVGKQSDKYYKYGKDRFRSRDDRRAPGAESRPSRITISDDNYFAEGHSLKDYVPRERGANADPALDLLVDTTEALTEQIQLNREVNFVQKLVDDLTGSSQVDLNAVKWDNDANDPIAKILTEKENIAKRIGVMPNKMFFSAPVFRAVRQNAKVLSRITGAPDLPSSGITTNQLAALLELEEVIVASAVKDTANEGAAASLDWIWGKRALLCYCNPSPGLRKLSIGYTFRWTGALQALGGQGAGGQVVERYYWQPNKADVVEVHDYYDLKTVDAGAGALFINAIA